MRELTADARDPSTAGAAESHPADGTFIGASPAFQTVLHTIDRVGPADSATLVIGETGVGKEVAARLLHTRSPRRDRPFVVVDCATLHEHLLQSELFGHEKGAFTGAATRKPGLFEVAHGGTLFLDEVGETSLDVQAKLLRVLESSHFRRLGGTREIGVDVRVISATNRDLWEATRTGRFREDLLFRLSTLTVRIPPLRERPEDIAVLVDHFTRRINHRLSLQREFSADALACLARYPWPGNVRELAHVVEQVIVLSDRAVIEPPDLSAAVRLGGVPTRTSEVKDAWLPLREIERRHVLLVVEHTKGNRSLAARILGVSTRNLYRLLKKYGWSARVRRVPAALTTVATESSALQDKLSDAATPPLASSCNQSGGRGTDNPSSFP
ncbi:MAG: sigma-54 dependent transcriptional regulator [Planctomycetota bacterium]